MLRSTYKKNLNPKTEFVFNNKLSLDLLERQIRVYFETHGYVVCPLIEDLLFNWLKNQVTEEKFNHTKNVVNIAKKIAQAKNIKDDKVVIAAILHDCAKNLDSEVLKSIVSANNLKVTEREKEKAKRMHGSVGSFLVQNRLGINDNVILQAVRHHSKGRPAMGLVENIVFLADKLEKII